MTTAWTSSRSAASVATASSSAWTWKLIAFILGRSRRIVPTPSVTSSRTNSPTTYLQKESARIARERIGNNVGRDTRDVEQTGRGRQRLAGTELSARVDLDRRVDELRRLCAERDRHERVPLRRGRHRDRTRADRADPRHLARGLARRAGRYDVRLSRRGTLGP